MLDILLVDDEASIRMLLGGALEEQGYRVTPASDGAQAMAYLDDRRFDVVITDVRLPKVDGFTILNRLRSEAPGTDVLMITGFGSVADAVAAMRAKAVDYLTKPFETEELLQTLQNIAERRRWKQEAERAAAGTVAPRGVQIIGESTAMVRLREQIEAVAGSDSAVLITGESGTGKELVAKSIHERSKRRDKPFVAINCAAVPQTLIEEELFGHERGAFTGAMRRRAGRFKASDGGTLFLDEIGAMPMEAQAKLLRVLQEGAFEPIGTNTTVKVDVRVLSATNVDLKASIADRQFREDLYYRVRVLELAVPPLRERRGDLPLLVHHFLSLLARGKGDPARLSPGAWAALSNYAFPGNVRELEHAIEHAVVLARGEEIDLDHLPPDLRGTSMTAPWRSSGVRPLSVAIDEFEREYLQRALTMTGGQKGRAAQILGISRKSLWQKLRKYGLAEYGSDALHP